MGKDFQSAMQPVTTRLNGPYLNQMRSAAIGGASVSTAIVLVLIQTGLVSTPQRVALYSAALSIPAWIGAWQYIQPYILYGPTSYEHLGKISSIGVAVILATFGMLTLAISLTSAIWHLSPCVSVLFMVASAVVAILVFMHNRSVQVAVDGKGRGT